jgi:hypothetical protein
MKVVDAAQELGMKAKNGDAVVIVLWGQKR